MKLVTYNVNGIKARLPRLLEYLSEAQPDVVCLQELKASDETFPQAEIADAGYRVVAPDWPYDDRDPALLRAPWPVLEAHILDVLERGRAAHSRRARRIRGRLCADESRNSGAA